MSYNVRMFNSYKWTKDKKYPWKKSTDFVTEKDPDILLTQEHFIGGWQNVQRDFPYNFMFFKG
ncbi:MAG: hypothetical protein MH186_07485 [Marinobacter sp.]|nr:hypothetical protein [Marinobacter sp.]